LEVQREFGNRQGIAKTLVWLGIVSQDEGDTSTAKTQLREALAIQQALGDRIYMAAALEAFAGLSLEFASPTEAARLWGRAQRLREEIGAPQGISDRARYERQVAAARSALHDDAAFDRAWDEGRSLTLDDVVRYAMDT
jgi:non-specific serine/threonine protein kinase